MCVDGNAEVTLNNQTESVSMGETVLIPANSGHVAFNAQDAKLLEVFIDSKDSNLKKIAS